MDRNSNSYTFIYAAVMVIVVAAILSFAATNLKKAQQQNVKIEKMQNILASVNVQADAAQAEDTYNKTVTNSYVVNSKGEKVAGEAFNVAIAAEYKKAVADRLLPVFECQINGETKYILPLYGAGLWGPIWGYVSLNADANTIYGANFDHQGETPGLGAEIATPAFQDQFKGKTIFNDGLLYSIMVAKSNENFPEAHSVDAISGGTITSKGLETMIKQDLEAYEAFLKTKQ
ncbi:MAG: NADH:ubiquinone reductase (Na(+)-transporting) subunit C [Mangrovibacterium sp.]